MISVGSLHRLGGLCLGLALLLLALSVPLHCVGKAAWVGGFALLDGALFGTALAQVTRTRHPLQIYGWLGVAALACWPLLVSWPPATAWDVHAWPDAPALLYNYFDLLRFGLFVLGFPVPFVGLGHHAPDPLPSPSLTLAASDASDVPNGLATYSENASGGSAKEGAAETPTDAKSEAKPEKPERARYVQSCKNRCQSAKLPEE